MKSLLIAFALLFSFGVQSQYVFDNKKSQKLYEKLENAYMDYDYATILDNEANINSTFVPKNDTLTARMYTFLGEAYEYEFGDLDKALEFYKKELALRRSLTPDQVNSDLIFNISSLMMELGRTKDAEGLYLEMVEADLERYGLKGEKYIQSELGLIDFYSFSNQPSKGLYRSKTVKKLVNRGSVDEALIYKAEGDFYEMTGEYTRSERSFNRALKIMEENDLYASTENVSMLSGLATLYTNQGKLPQAEELYLEALDILNKMAGDNEELIGSIKSNIARLYYELGNYDEAEKMYKEVLAQDLEFFGEESVNYGMTAYSLGLNQLYAGKYAESRKYNEIAKKVFEVALDPSDPLMASWNNSMSLLSMKVGEPEKALEYGNAAIKSDETSYGPDHLMISYPIFNMANAYMSLGDVNKADRYHQRALEIRNKRAGTKHPLYARSTNQIAILEWKKGNNAVALNYFEETFDNYYNQINTYFPILSEEEKSKFYYNKLRPTVEQFNAFVLRAAPDDKKLQGKMYDLQLTLKGLILSATTKVKQSILSSGDSVLIGKYETWLGQKEQLAQLFSDSQLAADTRNKRIDSLMSISDNLEKELSKLSAGFAKTIENKQPTWQDVKAKIKPGEAAIEMVRFRDFSTDSAGIFTNEVYYAALIVRHDTKDYPEMIVIRNGGDLETKFLSNYRNAIRYKIAENKSYALYWKPIANKLEGINKVYFSPDGVYNQISIYTLLNPDNKKYLLDEMDVRLVNNTKDLIAFSDKGSTSGASIFFGYPNYNMGAVEREQQKEKTGGSAADVVKAASENRGSRGGRGGSQGDLDLTKVAIPRGLRGNMLRYMRSNNLLALLPGTKKEVELIDSLYKANEKEKEVYLGNDALETQIKQLRKPRALHIATHGFFLEDGGEKGGNADGYVGNPLLRSGLIMAGANSFISSGEIGGGLDIEDDGILTAYEAMNLPLDDTEIVVLSACETGLGEVKNGEGVFGLQRAFQVAGAKAIIMSMWSVDDAATQELMTTFYKEWLKSGDKHQAFNAAQKNLKSKYKNPYYWGAFVMVGN
jgi:CHAT domain-containing protein/Tfp pilus assembly protein PilF